MYDILELNEKLLPELRQIAKDLNVKRVESFKKQELIYKILDEQAIQSTQNDKKPERKERQSNESDHKRGRKPKPNSDKQAEPTQQQRISETLARGAIVKDTAAEALNIEDDETADDAYPKIITDTQETLIEPEKPSEKQEEPPTNAVTEDPTRQPDKSNDRMPRPRLQGDREPKKIWHDKQQKFKNREADQENKNRSEQAAQQTDLFSTPEKQTFPQERSEMATEGKPEIIREPRNDNNRNEQKSDNNQRDNRNQQRNAERREEKEKQYEFEGIISASGVLENHVGWIWIPTLIRLQLLKFARRYLRFTIPDQTLWIKNR
jgi:Rho termination factor, N-terminal domain.